MKNNGLITCLVIFCILMAYSAVSADNDNFGWEGHEIFFLNNYDAIITNKDVKIEIEGDKLSFNGDYIVNNPTDQVLEIIIGLPVDQLDNLLIKDKGENIRYYNRNSNYIERNFAHNELPKVGKWITFNLWLKQDESRLINIKYDSKVINDNQGLYKTIYNNSTAPYIPDESYTLIMFKDFKPYNIADSFGAEIGKSFYNKGSYMVFECDKEYKEVRFEYELTDKLALEIFDHAPEKRLKTISESYKLKDYENVLVLCDEYLANPSTLDFDINQIKYMKADTLRNLTRYEDYLEIVKSIDMNRLHPDRLKYKVLFDIDEVIHGRPSDLELFATMKEIQQDALTKNDFLAKWMIHNEKEYLELAIDTDTEELNEDDINSMNFFSRYIYLIKTNTVINSIIKNKYFCIVLVVIMFLLGFYLGRRSGRRRRGSSYYTFKR